MKKYIVILLLITNNLLIFSSSKKTYKDPIFYELIKEKKIGNSTFDSKNFFQNNDNKAKKLNVNNNSQETFLKESISFFQEWQKKQQSSIEALIRNKK